MPDDASLTNAELQTLISTHQGSADATLSDSPIIEAGARNRPLDEVPAAFLRTLVHEAGHAFNLFHPKHDVHVPGVGTEIMNQTGDVMGFATAANPYPGNATFAFSSHDRTSLIHSPDPQVRPGWKGFGWGHGSLSSGLPEPTDAEGLVNQDDAADLTLDLRLLHALPGGDVEQVRDVVLACGPPQTTVLQPGESITSHVQVFFTSEGVTFDVPGRHVVRAEFDALGWAAVRSQWVAGQVRMAVAEAHPDRARGARRGRCAGPGPARPQAQGRPGPGGGAGRGLRGTIGTVTALKLTLEAPAEVPLDEALVVVVRLLGPAGGGAGTRRGARGVRPAAGRGRAALPRSR